VSSWLHDDLTVACSCYDTNTRPWVIILLLSYLSKDRVSPKGSRPAQGCLPEYKKKKYNKDQKIQDKMTTNMKYSTKTRKHTELGRVTGLIVYKIILSPVSLWSVLSMVWLSVGRQYLQEVRASGRLNLLN